MKYKKLWKYSFSYSLLLFIPFDLLASLGLDLYLPVIAEIKTNLNLSAEQLQLTLTLYMLILGLGQLVWGPLSDSIGRKPVVILGATTYSLASFLMAQTDSFSLFLSLRLLQAGGAAAMIVATFATIRDVYSEQPQGKIIYALMGSILAIVPAIAPFLGSIIALKWHWQGIFYTLGILSAIAAIHAICRWQESRPCTSQPFTWDNLLSILTNTKFIGYTLAYAAAMGSFFVYFSIAPIILMEKLGLDKLSFSLVFGTVALVMLAATHLIKAKVMRLSCATTVYYGFTLLVVASMVLALIELTFGLTIIGFMLPIYFVGIAIAIICAASANGALADFANCSGLATALYFALESIFVAVGVSIILAIVGSATSIGLTIYVLVCVLLALFFLKY